jgi:uncharacterized protein (TIGR04255 family)
VARVYKSPPVIEAVSEFRFEGSQPWDWTIPGLIYKEIMHVFPKKRQRNVVELAMQPEGDKVHQQLKAGIAKMQFVREDETALVQVGPDLLAVNQLRPYPSWEEFKKLTVEQLRIYQHVAMPKRFRRLGLRYINRIDIPGEKVDLDEYFIMLPRIPEKVPQELNSLLLQVEIPYPRPRGLLRLVFGTAPTKKQHEQTFMLDLDFYLEGDDLPAFERVEEWLEAAHERVKIAFDSSFTDKTHRQVFEEVIQ